MQKKHFQIYQSQKHLLFTLLTIIVPFLFLLFFSKLANIATSKLFFDVFISFSRLFIAYFIGVFFAWLLAVSFYRGRKADIALPIFDVLQSFPTFALLPLFTFFFHPSNYTIIFFLVTTVIWPILFSIISSLKLIKHDWEEAVTIIRLKGFNYLRYFLLPASISGLITGSIIGLGDGFEVVIATEIIVNAKTGLGNFFQSFAQNPTITAFGILGFLIIIFTINRIIWLPLLEWSHHKIEE